MRKKLLAVFLCAGMCASVLAGCANGGSKESSNQVPSAQSQEKNNSVDKTLTAGATTGFFGAESLDVANNWDGWIMSIYGISENLFRLDKDYVPQPWLVESYENTDDTTWVFTIKDNVTFSDGTKVTADAVKKCFERTYKNNERANSTLAIKSMKAENQKLTIITPEANPTMLNDLCDPLLGIYDSEGTIDKKLGVSCTGPYLAEDFTAMTEVKMIKNDAYWGGEPQLDHVDLKIMDDEDSLNMALQNGEIDMVAQMSASSTKLFTDASKYTIDGVTTTRSNFLMYNLKNEGVKEQAVREAIGYCIDRESYANVVYNGYATACYGVYPEFLSFGDTSGLTLSVDSYNPDKAVQILKDAGINTGDLSFNLITYSYNTACQQLADMLQAELSKIGIQLTIDTYDVLDDKLSAGDFDIAILSYAMAPIGTPQYFTNMLFTTDASNNYGGYSNKTVDSLAKKLGTTLDTTESDKLTKEICQEIIKEKPCDFVANQQLICTYAKNVTGLTVNPSEYYLIDSKISLTE